MPRLHGLPFPLLRKVFGIGDRASPGREPEGSLDGWRRCKTMEMEGMAGMADRGLKPLRFSSAFGISPPF